MITRVTILVLLANFLTMTYANANTYMLRRATCLDKVTDFLDQQVAQGYRCQAQARPAKKTRQDKTFLSYVYQCDSRKQSYIVQLELALDTQNCDLGITVFDHVPQSSNQTPSSTIVE